MALTEWTMQGTEVVNCSCECGCPCQFSRLPTHGYCRAVIFVQIDKGRFGDVPLDGLRWGIVEETVGPLRNQVTGNPSRARITLPAGFEFTEAEVASGTSKVTGDLPLDFNETHAHLARVHWSTHGVVR